MVSVGGGGGGDDDDDDDNFLWFLLFSFLFTPRLTSYGMHPV